MATPTDALKRVNPSNILGEIKKQGPQLIGITIGSSVGAVANKKVADYIAEKYPEWGDWAKAGAPIAVPAILGGVLLALKNKWATSIGIGMLVNAIGQITTALADKVMSGEKKATDEGVAGVRMTPAYQAAIARYAAQSAPAVAATTAPYALPAAPRPAVRPQRSGQAKPVMWDAR